MMCGRRRCCVLFLVNIILHVVLWDAEFQCESLTVVVKAPERERHVAALLVVALQQEGERGCAVLSPSCLWWTALSSLLFLLMLTRRVRCPGLPRVRREGVGSSAD